MRLPLSLLPALSLPWLFFSPRTFSVTTRSRSDSGLMVFRSTVPDRPWPTRDASDVLYTVTPLISSDGYWSYSTVRFALVLTCSRPFSSAVDRSPDVPRMLICCAWPLTRCADRPGRRASDSAMLMSGSLPMSSAEMVSTMLVESRLTAIASSILRRMPVTVTVLTGAAATSPSVVCADAWAPSSVRNTAQPTATGLSWNAG